MCLLACVSGEHVYELAMYLDLLNRHCFPRWPQVFAMAESAMGRLQEGDRELHDHLKYIAQVEPSVNPKVSFPCYYSQKIGTFTAYVGIKVDIDLNQLLF